MKTQYGTAGSMLGPTTVREIMVRVFPGSQSRSMLEQSRLHADIRDILDGRPTPARSRAEREAVEAAAAKLQEGSR